MKRHLFTLFFTTACLCAAAQEVPKAVMEHIYQEVKTPFKYGLVVAPADNYHKFDCPTVFRDGNKWLMTYVCYDGKDGTDGRGYETWLAESDDLLHWTTKGKVLQLPSTTPAADSHPATSPSGTPGANTRSVGDRQPAMAWDQNQRGGFPALIDWTWGGTYEMQTYKKRHWMTYIGGPGTGYEAVNAPLSIGLATTKEPITSAHPWQTFDQPLLSYDDRDAQWWEQLTQYKSTIYWMKDKQQQVRKGYPFTMYYNAGGKDDTHPKGERIGIAVSKDMRHWQRYEGNPVFAHDSDGTITGDAQLVDMTGTVPDELRNGQPVYVMFYFSAFNPTRDYNAFNTFAVSTDLIHWQDWTGPDLIVPSKPYDEMFAHKSYVVKHEGTVYHFYCAVNNDGQRGIAVATSRHLGKSEVCFPTPEPTGHRFTQQLADGWKVTLLSTEKPLPAAARPSFLAKDNLSIPINLDDYYGTQQGEHGNLHGEALFEQTFRAPDLSGKAFFLRFEGVGTFADITLNDHSVGHYDIGRTTQTIDVTPYIRPGQDNHLSVKVSHPAAITNMPWVCGGCSSEWGFSEGSQPFGIYRPVVLEATDAVRVEPFGVHVWNNDACDSVYVETELRNYGKETHHVQLVSKLCDKSGKQVVRLTEEIDINPGQTVTCRQASPMKDARRWSTADPYLYDMNTIVKRNGKATESTHTPFGFVTVAWPRAVCRNQIATNMTETGSNKPDNGSQQFLLNGKPVFINGVCEYEHAFGQSHAFTNEQIEARVKLVKDAGFNAFRDAHQPHNLHYQELFDREGILWWPQFSAHIWYDTPEFRESFKRHLRQWVKERRNSPSIILWGLQNESTLPKDFAEECTAIIREMDPRSRSGRLVTTCNGGEGTDWNVVQNWSGTYGGDIDNYGNELKRTEQLLNGEYGAWRTVGNHTGEGYTEERFADLLMKKVRLAESVRDSVCGQFLWLLVSHDNPGRRQPDEALRRIDKVGPYNYKGLFTPWEQPTDAFYRYQQHYNPQPVAPQRSLIDESVLRPADGFTYLYRINCGGDAYTDEMGNRWMQDNTAWSHSWGERFGSPYQTSQTVNDSLSSPLFRSSRFGRHELSYRFPAHPGRYRVELYFVEPWYRQADAEGLRIFDVAINDSTVVRDLDIWAQVHYGKPYKRVIDIDNKASEIKIDFPKVKAGQAMIAAIAIATNDWKTNYLQSNLSPSPYSSVNGGISAVPPTLWADFGKDILVKTPDSLLPPKSSAALEVEGRKVRNRMEWDFTVGVAKVYALRWKYYNPEQPRTLHVRITDAKGVVYKDDDVTFLQTQQKKTKRKTTSITTGTQVNAGTYHVVLTGDGLPAMLFDNLTIE